MVKSNKRTIFDITLDFLKKFALDEKPDNRDWITLENGVHVPVENGQSKKVAVTAFLEKKKPEQDRNKNREKIIKILKENGYDDSQEKGAFVRPESGFAFKVDRELDTLSQMPKDFLEEQIGYWKPKIDISPQSPQAAFGRVRIALAKAAYEEQFGELLDEEGALRKYQEEEKKKADAEFQRNLEMEREQDLKKERREQIENLQDEPIFKDKERTYSKQDDFLSTAILPSYQSHSSIITPELSNKEERLLKDYSGPAFTKINRLAREDANNPDVKLFDNILSRSETTKPLVLFRGEHGDKSTISSGDGFLSTTTDFEVARRYKGKEGRIYEVHVPSGMQAISMVPYSKYEESEIVLPRGLKTAITGYRRIGDDIVEVVEVKKQDADSYAKDSATKVQDSILNSAFDVLYGYAVAKGAAVHVKTFNDREISACLVHGVLLGYAIGKDILDALAEDSNQWITVKPNGQEHTGAHVLIEGETGEIKAGMGGKFTGKKLHELPQSKNPHPITEEKWQARQERTAKNAASSRPPNGDFVKLRKLKSSDGIFDEIEKRAGLKITPAGAHGISIDGNVVLSDKERFLKNLVFATEESLAAKIEDYRQQKKDAKKMKDAFWRDRSRKQSAFFEAAYAAALDMKRENGKNAVTPDEIAKQHPPYPLSAKEIESLQKKDKAATAKPSVADPPKEPSDIDVASHYTYQGDRIINSLLRRGSNALVPARTIGDIEALDKMMEQNKLKETTVLYRGIVLSKMPKGFDKDQFMAVGSTFSDPAFLSTSRSFVQADNFASGEDGAVLRLIVPKGVGAINMQPVSKYPHEKEILLDRNLKWENIGVIEQPDGPPVVTLKLKAE